MNKNNSKSEGPMSEEVKKDETTPAAPAEEKKDETAENKDKAPAPAEGKAANENVATPPDAEGGFVEVTDLQTSINALTKAEQKSNSLLWTLIRGILSGFGVVIGSVLLTALFVWMLSLFDTLPIFGKFITKIVDIVRQSSGK